MGSPTGWRAYGAMCGADGRWLRRQASRSPGAAIVPSVLADSPVAGFPCLTLAMAGLELTVPVAWALCLELAGDFSGSVTGVMNTFGNLGGSISLVVIGYLSTRFGWNVPFIVCSMFCGVAAVLARRVDPNRSAVGEFQAASLKS